MLFRCKTPNFKPSFVTTGEESTTRPGHPDREKRWIRARQASKPERGPSDATGAEHEVFTGTTSGNSGRFASGDRMPASKK